MAKKIFFQSSLPRAGSTLLQNLFSQRPDMHGTSTDGVLELLVGAQYNYTNSPEFKAQDPEVMRRAFLSFCNAGLHAYADELTNKDKVVIKSRGMGAYMPFLESFMGKGNVKVVCMIRDLRDVFASMEKNHRKSPEKASSMINWAEMRNITLPQRIDSWAQGQPIGLAISRIRNILDLKYDKDMLFVKYEDLCLYPDNEMRRIYNYFGIEDYKHDFDNIEQVTKEDDSVYGFEGLHDIRQKLDIKPSDAKSVLGVGVCNWIYDNFKWFYDQFGYRK